MSLTELYRKLFRLKQQERNAHIQRLGATIRHLETQRDLHELQKEIHELETQQKKKETR